MGTDNLHHINKERKLNSLKREKNKRKSYDVALIVCEGEKTEPYYFEKLRDELKLSTANIKITPAKSSAPLNIVNYSLKKFNEENKTYDKIYCVFDRDQHVHYKTALNMIETLRKKKSPIPIYAITSVPCFEYWILLHFEDTTRPYKAAGKKSAGDQLISAVRRHLPKYCKGDKDIFESTYKNLNIAIKRAEKIDTLQQKNGTDNPSTQVYKLVKYLRNLDSK